MKYPHGTHAGYSCDRCRCNPCRTANRLYEQARLRNLLYGRTPWHYDMQPVRDHIAALRAAGYGTRTIADIADVDRKQIQRIIAGRGGHDPRPPAAKIQKAVAEAILAIDIPDLSDDVDRVAVDRFLGGEHTLARTLTRDERLAVIDMWMDRTGLSMRRLHKITGWNVERYKRERNQPQPSIKAA